MKIELFAAPFYSTVVVITVSTDGSVNVTSNARTIAMTAEGSVERQPIYDMVHTVQIDKNSKVLIIEVTYNDVIVTEKDAVFSPQKYPTYRDMLNMPAAKFACDAGFKRSMSNDILDVVRAALTHARDEADALRAELEAEQARPKWNGKT